MSITPFPSRDLKPHEWDSIRPIFVDLGMEETLDKLRHANNEPQPAEEIFPEKLTVPQERANNALRRAMLPYRITRIGSWRRGDRNQRPLAIVRWPVGIQTSMRGLGKRSYRRYPG